MLRDLSKVTLSGVLESEVSLGSNDTKKSAFPERFNFFMKLATEPAVLLPFCL